MAQEKEYGRRQNISTADIETANIFELILYALANGTGDQSLGIDENGKAKIVAGGAAAWGEITGTLTDQAEIDTDVALAADSDLKLATQKAVKGYVDAHAGAGGLGYALNVQGTLPGTLSDGVTYYAGNALMSGVYTAANKNRIYIRKAGTIKIADILLYSGSVVGTNEEISVYIRLNDTADTLISALSVADAMRDFNNSALSVAVVAGDYITIKMVCPTWATNPEGAYISGHVYIE
jgi:hypothetical protein